MLPDFPEVKKQFRAVLMTKLERDAASMGFFGRLRTKRQYEGDRFHSTSFDGHRHEDGFKTSQATFEITKEELLKTDNSFELFARKMQEMAQEIVVQREGMAIRKLNDVTRATGNVVDAGGKPFTPDMLLNLLKKVDIEFSPDGKPHLPTFLVGPQLYESIKKKIPEWDADPEYRKRFDAIVDEKRRVWVDRENSRQLAD